MPPKVVHNPETHGLLIYTWGKNNHKYPKPPGSQKNFNVCGVSYKEVSRGIDLRTVRGDDDELYKRISSSDLFQSYIDKICEKIATENLNVISVNCSKGRHRSRAVCRGILERYKNGKFIHLDA